MAFIGTALLSQIGHVRDDIRVRSEAFRSRILLGWAHVAARRLSEAEWRTIGSDLDGELEAEESRWVSWANEMIDIERKIIAAEKVVEFEFYPKTRAISIIRRGLEDGAQVETVPSFGVRADASLRYSITKMVDARRRFPSTNDWIDARHLKHLAWPAFLVTTDFRLIQAVDATGSYQRAWVRTPAELIEERVARCEPWGKPARSVSLGFRRWSTDRLRERYAWYRQHAKSTPANAV